MVRSKILGFLTSLLIPTAALAGDAKLTEGQYYTLEATGCMILQECTEGVIEIKTHKDLSKFYGKFPMMANDGKEFDALVSAANKVGTQVFLAPEKYFPPGNRGIYHTVSNNFYLNATLVKRYGTLMSVMRHEGWHAAQDCMAGTIENSLIAIIFPEEDVPPIWREIAEKTYVDTPSAIPWEAEAIWAGKTEGMTMKALQACANGNMWEVYKPTPLTLEWLQQNGYIK